MTKVIIGLVIGALLCGIAGYIEIPKIKQTSYDSGFTAGVKKGTEEGTTAGIAQGIAQVKAQQKQEHDNMVAAQQKQEAAHKRSMKRRKKVEPPVQNWHVIDGKISEPITN